MYTSCIGTGGTWVLVVDLKGFTFCIIPTNIPGFWIIKTNKLIII